MRCRIAIAIVLSAIGAAVMARGDVVYLTDGSHLEGKLVKNVDGWVLTTADGKNITLKTSQVQSIEASRTSTTDVAADRFASLRRAVDHLSDIRLIIDRYEKFLQQNPNSAVQDDANGDLATWHQRLDQGLVKLGGEWITPEARNRLRQEAQTQAIVARDFLRQNKVKEAQATLAEALKNVPESALALYLQGVMSYRLEQVAAAKKAFDAANEAQPNDAATLNNLGVVAWRQKSYVAALNYYDQSMIARPLQKQVLDNTLEALHAVPPESKQAPAVVKAARDFAEQDVLLQAQAAREGMFRWGSSWVTAKQLEDMKVAEAQNKAQIDQMTKDFDTITGRMGEIDGEIDANLREMHRLQASVSYVDTNGTQIQLPLPRAYYDLASDIDKLNASKKVLVQQQEALRTRAKAAQAQISVPPFGAPQKILGEDAAPTVGMLDAVGSGGSTTQSSTRP